MNKNKPTTTPPNPDPDKAAPENEREPFHYRCITLRLWRDLEAMALLEPTAEFTELPGEEKKG